MSKVGIIGVGHVGSEVAFALATKGICDELVLIDEIQEKAESEALELQDMMAYSEHHTAIYTQDYDRLKDADLVIIAIGKIDLLQEDRMEELKEAAGIIKEIIPKLMATGFKQRILSISNPCDVIATLIQKLSGLPARQVIGTGTSLDTARLKRKLGELLDITPKSIEGFVMGEHGESQFVPWSSIRIGGVPLLDLPQARDFDLPKIKDLVRGGGWKILLGKGWTSFGIATVTASITETLLSSVASVYPLSVYDERYGVYIGQPALIHQNGVKQVLEIPLTVEEQKQLDASAKVIQDAFKTITE